MNHSFSFNRWLLLVKQHWAENKKRYLLAILALAGMLVMWFFFVFLIDKNSPMSGEIQRNTYFFLLLVIGCFYASQFFKEFNDKSSAIHYLMIPASTLEKFLCGFFYTVIIFFCVSIAVFYLADGIMVGLANAFHPAYEGGAKAKVINIWNEPGEFENVYYIFLVFFAIQAAFFLGSLYFEKYSFIKTVISLFAFFLTITFLIQILNDTFLPNGDFHDGLGTYRVMPKNGEDVLIQLPEVINTITKYLMLFGFAPFFWIVTYFRLKEKQV